MHYVFTLPGGRRCTSRLTQCGDRNHGAVVLLRQTASGYLRRTQNDVRVFTLHVLDIPAILLQDNNN